MVTGRKLLLADDSVTIQKVIDLTFSDEGIEVTTVGNGEQAILKLEEIQPDIVLADIFMPGRTGYEVCEHIKRDERFRHIPVLLLVGSFEPFDEAEARRVGADDYLTKPFQSIRQLVNKVTSLIGGGGNTEDEASTRDLELPEELAAKEDARSNGGADIYTADTAPLSKEVEAEVFKEEAAHLAGHDDRDDELIEARPANPLEETERTTEVESQTRPTEPLSFADLAQTGIKPQAEEANEGGQQEGRAPFQETLRDLELNEMNEDPLSTEPQEKGAATTTTRYMTNAAAADEALLDLGDIEPPVAATEADDFILDLQDDAPPAPQLAQAQAASSPWSEAPQPAMEEAPVAGSAQPFDDSYAHGFSEESVLGTIEAAPSAAPESFIDEGPGPVEATFEDEAPRVAELQDSFEPQEPLAQGAQAPQESAQGAGQITLAQLSPEAIDAIARRAVELLSSKVVEQVAWEVVPQLAELLIKRKLEEEKTQ